MNVKTGRAGEQDLLDAGVPVEVVIDEEFPICYGRMLLESCNDLVEEIFRTGTPFFTKGYTASIDKLA